MDNPLWNLIVRASSILAAVLLLLATILVLSGFWSDTGRSGAGVVTLAFAVIVSVFALFAANLSDSRRRQDMRDAVELAHRISQGGTPSDAPETEIAEALSAISDYMAERSRQFVRIGAGDLSENIAPRSDGDQFGESMQLMVERLRAIVGTKESRERLQSSIVRLLDEVSEVAAGDLTVQAHIGPEITGEIAEALNQMTRNLRALIKQVKDVTMQVAASASAISDTTEQLADGSVAQASQISRTTAAIAEMAQQVLEVSRNATVSAEVAAETLRSSRSGTQAARENIEAMASIRRQVQETAKRIKKLGERAQEISQITNMIDDLSDRTGLLALNATLQASAADSGDGFAAVAEEVERLAERSNRLTQQISTLTQAINLETKDVVAAMEETIREVIEGSSLADKAGRSLVEIERISGQLAELLKSISESAKFQAKSSEDVSSAMAGISEVTALVERGSRRAAESARTLVELSKELRNSVAPFKLPMDMHQSMNGHQEATFLN